MIFAADSPRIIPTELKDEISRSYLEYSRENLKRRVILGLNTKSLIKNKKKDRNRNDNRNCYGKGCGKLWKESK